MNVSEYNAGKSVADLDIKDWSYGHPRNLRSESTWQDNRYDPMVYPHAHRYDNANFPDQEYKDVFGGTKGTAETESHEKHNIGIMSGESTAMVEHQREVRKDSLRAAVADVNAANAKEE